MRSQSKTITLSITTPTLGLLGLVVIHQHSPIAKPSSKLALNRWPRRESNSEPLLPAKYSLLSTNGIALTLSFVVYYSKTIPILLWNREMLFLRFQVRFFGTGQFLRYLLDQMPKRLTRFLGWKRKGRACLWRRLRILERRLWLWGWLRRLLQCSKGGEPVPLLIWTGLVGFRGRWPILVLIGLVCCSSCYQKLLRLITFRSLLRRVGIAVFTFVNSCVSLQVFAWFNLTNALSVWWLYGWMKLFYCFVICKLSSRSWL